MIIFNIFKAVETNIYSNSSTRIFLLRVFVTAYVSKTVNNQLLLQYTNTNSEPVFVNV